jgi:biopolymer transport protein ExbD
MTRRSFELLAIASLVLLGGCDEPPKRGAAATATATSPVKPAVSSAEPAKPKGMPELLVDSMGPYLAGKRVDMAAKDSRDRLTQIVKELPIEAKQVTLAADKQAKTPHVAAVVTELGKAGAPKVTIKTDGRDDLPKEIVLTPETRVVNPPGCAIAAMVLKDLSTAVWPIAGGVGKRQRKGFAGPDLTVTGETLKKDLAGCESSTAFVSGDDGVSWEMTYNLAATMMAADDKKRIDTLVLLHEAPVAGRAVAAGRL